MNLKKLLEDIARKYGVKVVKVIIFGSRARGDFREGSDMDIYVIVNHYDPRFHDEIYKALGTLGVEADVVVSTEDSFRKYSATPGTFENIVAKEGIEV